VGDTDHRMGYNRRACVMAGKETLACAEASRTMPLVIPDDVLREAGMTEQDALIEIACHLFDTGRLTLWKSARMAGLTRIQFEEELLKRKIAIYRPTLDDLKADLETIERLGQ